MLDEKVGRKMAGRNTVAAGRMAQNSRTTGRKIAGQQAAGSTDEVRGRKSAPQHQRSPRRNSPVSFVAMAMATWSCSGASSHCYSIASSRHYSTTSSQRSNAATRVAAAVQARIATTLQARNAAAL
jgi:hypothetical protein